jgi:hypothetical protein
MDSPAVMQVLLHRHTIEILQTVKTKTSWSIELTAAQDDLFPANAQW